MGAEYESSIKRNVQASPVSDASSTLSAEVFLATLHVGVKFDPNDKTPYPADSPVVKIYKSLAPSMGEIRAPHSAGTGYFVSGDGYMLTDQHVVIGATSVQIFANGSWHQGVCVDRANVAARGEDLGTRHDLALVKVIPNGNETFKRVKFAPLHSVSGKDPLVVVGFPKGLDTLFVSPTADLDSKLQAATRPRARSIPVKDCATLENIGPGEDINRKVILSDMAAQHGNSGSVLATLGRNGEGLVLGAVELSDVAPQYLAELPNPDYGKIPGATKYIFVHGVQVRVNGASEYVLAVPSQIRNPDYGTYPRASQFVTVDGPQIPNPAYQPGNGVPQFLVKVGKVVPNKDYTVSTETMSTREEDILSFLKNERIPVDIANSPSDARLSLSGPVVIPTQHVGMKFDRNDRTAYAADSPVAKIYKSLLPSVGEVCLPYGKGTGFFVTKDGYMLTDRHGLDRASFFQVLANGTMHQAFRVHNAKAAEDLGARDDLALVKVVPNGNETFKPVNFAPSHSVKATDPLVIVGYPKCLDTVFVSPTADLDGKLHSRTQSQAQEIPLSSCTLAPTVGLTQDINRHVIKTEIATEPGNSGSVLATLGPNGEAFVLGISATSAVEPQFVVMNGRQTLNPRYEIGTITLCTPERDIRSFLNNAGVRSSATGFFAPAEASVRQVPPYYPAKRPAAPIPGPTTWQYNYADQMFSQP